MEKHIIGLLALMILSGCSSKTVVLKETDSQLMADKEKAYIVFSRTSNFVGAGIGVNIFKFDKDMAEIEHVASTANDEKTIYKVSEGKHYFYSDITSAASAAYIAEVSVAKGETVWVNLSMNSDMNFFPKIYTQKRVDEYAELAKVKKCSDDVLKKYLFKAEQQEEQIKTISYYSPAHFEIECADDVVVKLRDVYYFQSIEDLKKPTSVQLAQEVQLAFEEKKQKQKKIISEFVPVFEAKYSGNIPVTEKPFLNILKAAPNSEKYAGVNFKVSKSEIADGKKVDGFMDDLKNKFPQQKQNSISVTCTFHKLDEGSMLAKYMTNGLLPATYDKNITVWDIELKFEDAHGSNVGHIRVSEFERIGAFGGISTIYGDLLELLIEYIEVNYLIKTDKSM